MQHLRSRIDSVPHTLVGGVLLFLSSGLMIGTSRIIALELTSGSLATKKMLFLDSAYLLWSILIGFNGLMMNSKIRRAVEDKTIEIPEFIFGGVTAINLVSPILIQGITSLII